MGRAPCCDKANVKRGPWSPEEDATLKTYVQTHGTGGNWIALPGKAGLRRCGKSCRLRWLNYLRPDIKHGGFTEEEDHIICNLYNQMGSRWSVIASRLPGRTDNDVKNYWNTKLKKKLLAGKISLITANNTITNINTQIPTKNTPTTTTTTTTTTDTTTLCGSTPSLQPPCVPKVEITHVEYSPASLPNSQSTHDHDQNSSTLRMLADINYSGLSIINYDDQKLSLFNYDPNQSYNPKLMDWSGHHEHDYHHKNSSHEHNIINVSSVMSQDGSSNISNSSTEASKRALILSGNNGCSSDDHDQLIMDFGFGSILPYDIINGVSTNFDHQ